MNLPMEDEMTQSGLDRTKDQILESALNVFSELDYISIDEIAVRAGISKDTVYRYFKNKEELFVELLVHAAAIRKQAIYDNIRMIEDIRGKLGRFIISILRFAKNQPHYFRLLTMDVTVDPPELQAKIEQIQREYEDIVYQLLQEGIRENRFRDVNPLIATTLLCKMIDGALRILEEEPNYSADQIVLTMLDLIWNGYGKK